MKLRLGTRGTDLAMARTNQVAEDLRALGHEVEVVPVTTSQPDTNHMRDGLSFQGQFATELRQALRDGLVDAVVHSTKDLPIGEQRQSDLVIAAVPKRDDWRDALISRGHLPLAALPAKARVGVTSLRRIAQLRRLRPDLTFIDLGGTMEERIARVQPGDLDAVVLSASALQRTGKIDMVAEFLPILPAPGQGAKSIECRAGDHEVIAAVGQIEDLETRICVAAERDLMFRIGADYRMPLGALASRRGILNLKACAVSIDAEKYIQLEIGMPTSLLHAKRVGTRMAEAFLERDVMSFLSPKAFEGVEFTSEHDDETGTLNELGPDAPRLLLPRQEGRLSRSFRDSGVSVDTAPLQIAELLPEAENLLEAADWVLFPSAHTIWAVRERGWRVPKGMKIAAMGSTTRQLLEDRGRTVTLSPEGTASSRRLIEMFPEGNERVVIPCSDDLSSRLEDGLSAKGYQVVRMPIYRMVDVDQVVGWVARAWESGSYDGVLLTTPSVARAFVKLLPKRPDVAILAWDEDTAEVLRGEGFVVSVAPSKDERGVTVLTEALREAKQRR
ncbi:hydroxymethylbilane synthase [Tessaracoccus sp. OH4464_COT-324]|uniref:hydroxymethylbilane synthase n=1 Tax=Tessaracoccus sp. OH4464_COT-324 TaxID=2491059 RepID=UPI000F6353EF|nr:hydroxymethylbilane synthase [Tessaracoccus sp. OH4464_COT-324]RRD47775.1 hydroxymethylbilane synthase [Tessaracoccus sp. OH4464_COT-324]